MSVEVMIAGEMGSFRRVDKKNEFRIGEYYRTPNGKIYFYHSDDPKVEFMLVLENDIPKNTPIIDLERGKW